MSEQIASQKIDSSNIFSHKEYLVRRKILNQVGTIREDSLFLAMIRRFLTNLVPQTYHGMIGDKTVCIFRQNFNPFVTKIRLDFSMDAGGLLDRRLGIAAAVLLCAIEGKQN